MEIGTSISNKIKTAIKSKLVEYGSYIDNELPDYIMVMVANKRSQEQMSNDLNLFLGNNSKVFCEWLHDLLNKLQEVTEGAFEVKIPMPMQSEVKIQTNVKNEGNNESLKISKLTRKPSPIRMNNDATVNDKDNINKLKEADKKSELNAKLPQSTVVVQKRPQLPAAKQASINLLKKAMKAVQPPGINPEEEEYNPEAPGATTDLPSGGKVTDPESKKRQLEYLMEEHKKLQRIKSQQEEPEGNLDPVIELQAVEDEELFKTEEASLVKDRRIVVDKQHAGVETENGTKTEEGKKENKKGEKRKLENGKSDEEAKSGSNDEDRSKDVKRSVKTKDKKRKPKFIVTLEGVDSAFEEKYEKEKKRKRQKSKEIKRIEAPAATSTPGIHMIPVFPPSLIQDGQQVAIIPPVQHISSVIPTTQLVSAPTKVVPTTVMATVDALKTNTDEVDMLDEDGDVEMSSVGQEKCRFWPQCKNGDNCPYYHPGKTCRHFPNCRYGKDCAYSHPPCKFGLRCTSTSCPYSHNTPSQPESSTTLCKFYPFCSRPDCPFQHPAEPCRYGSSCSRPGCPFTHSATPSREQLKWVAAKPHVSERQFAVNESSTEPLKVQ